MSAPVSPGMIMAGLALWVLAVIQSGLISLAENMRWALVACLVLSNLTALKGFWVVQAHDYWIGTAIIVMMALSMVSHALEMLPNFLDNQVWNRANTADRIFMYVFVFLTWGRLAWAHQVSVLGVLDNSWGIWYQHWGLTFVTVALMGLNRCSTKIRYARTPVSYAIYVLFHSVWHLYIYRVLADFLSIALQQAK